MRIIGLSAVWILPTIALAQPGESVFVPKNLYLVEARTLEVGTREVAGPSPRAKIPEAKFEVTKVYVGPDWLKKRIFACDQIPYQITVASALDRLHVNVAFEKGAVGLWWVSYDSLGEGSLLPMLKAGYVDALGIRPFPYQKIQSEGNRHHKTAKKMEASFQEGLAWAEAAGKVYRAKSDKEREELLCDYASERSPQSGWAIASLRNSGKPELAQFLRKLIADEKQPIASQVILDSALMSVDRKNWEDSKEQAALYQSWRKTYQDTPPFPIPLQVMDAQRKLRFLPPLFSSGTPTSGKFGQ